MVSSLKGYPKQNANRLGHLVLLWQAAQPSFFSSKVVSLKMRAPKIAWLWSWDLKATGCWVSPCHFQESPLKNLPQKYRIQTTGLGKSAGNPGILNVSSICWGWRLPPLRWCDTPQVDGVKFGMHRQGPLMDHKETARAPGVSRGLGGWALGKSISVNWSGFSPTSPANGWRMVVMCAHRYINIFSNPGV